MSRSHAHAHRTRCPAPTLGEFIAALQRLGCRPREVRPGVVVATCPICAARGHPHAMIVVADAPEAVE